MDAFLNDIRYAIRNLIKRPAFTLIAAITLALGIGANSAIFSSVYALLLRPLPFPELDRVVAVWDSYPGRGVKRNEVSMANYLDWRAQNQSFEQLALYRWWSVNLTGIDPPERIQGFLITANFLDALGVKPIVGRNFTEENNQPGADDVAIITYNLWQRRFGGDPDIVGKKITLSGTVCNIVGVMPERFAYPANAEVYAPIAFTPNLTGNRRFNSYYVLGRLKPGASVQSAQADIDNITARLEQQYPETNTGVRASVFPIVADTVRKYEMGLWMGMAAVGFVLLIYGVMAFAVTQRTREIGIRMALGARKTDVLKLVVANGMRLAVLGLAIGLVASWALTRFISNLLFGVEPTDPLTFSAVSLSLLAAAFLACYLPARRATKINPLEALRYE